MAVMHDEIRRLIEQPRESLAVEIKNWLPLAEPKSQAKIIKAVIALRNLNGGFMIFGFEKTMKPSPNPPSDPAATFTIDLIQGWISRFSSDQFEVGIEFPERDGTKHPVIVVPGGVKSIVATKSELKDINGDVLISPNEVYIRTLNANNTPSTAKPGWKDWPGMVQICFDNREADIGNFLRRHLGGLSDGSLGSLLQPKPPEPSKEDATKNFFNEARTRFNEIKTERKLQLPDHGFWEAALVIQGEVPTHRTNKEFLRRLDASNPRYTGWPIWLNSENFTDQVSRPQVHNNRWEMFLLTLEGGWGDHIEYMSFDPGGKFYLRRNYEDDLGNSGKQPRPLTTLEFALVILRTAELLAVGVAFAKAMGCEPEKTSLSFLFKWSRLKGRVLSSWANPGRYLSSDRTAYQDEVFAYLEMPLDLPISRLGEYVKKAIDPLFEVFDGFEIGQSVVDDLTNQLINRRL